MKKKKIKCFVRRDTLLIIYSTFNKNQNMNVKSVLKKYFESNKEYTFEVLSDFVQRIKLPTPLIKQKGVMFILVTNGNIELISGINKIKAIKDNFIAIQPNKPFSFESFSEDLNGYILILNGEGSLGSMGSHSLIFNLEFLETWSNSLFDLTHLPTEYIENIFKRINWEKNSKNKNLTIINAYIITLLLEINQCYNEVSKNNRAVVEISRKFKTEINQSINLNLSITEYAKRLSITPNHLNKTVKKATGISASQLVINFKIVEAKYLLMLLDVNIGEIASKLGFTDTSYFIRFFKKHTALTPVEYRKKIDLSY